MEATFLPEGPTECRGRRLARLLASILLVCGACGEPPRAGMCLGSYRPNLEATLRVVECEFGVMTEGERAALAGVVGVLGPHLTLLADGTFSWDNGPRDRRSGLTIGAGRYRVQGGTLHLEYDELTEGAAMGKHLTHRIQGESVLWRYGDRARDFILLTRAPDD